MIVDAVSDALPLDGRRAVALDHDTELETTEPARPGRVWPATACFRRTRSGSRCTVIAEYVAERTRTSPDDLLPQTVGQVSLGLALTAYQAWLADEDAALHDLLAATMTHLRDYLTS